MLLEIVVQEDKIYEKLRVDQAGVVGKMKWVGGSARALKLKIMNGILIFRSQLLNNLPARMWMLRVLVSMLQKSLTFMILVLSETSKALSLMISIGRVARKTST